MTTKLGNKPFPVKVNTINSHSELRSDIDLKHNDMTKKIAQRVEALWHDVPYTETPPFPRQMLVEVANICNHSCVFCAYSKMTRPKGVLDLELYQRIIQQAFDLGVREIGLYSGAEPLTVKRIADYVDIANRIGFTYIYMTTNGALGNEERFKRLLDAGLDSIKFSINGADRKTYTAVHGKDDFEKVIDNLYFVNNYRKKIERKVYLAVSFVECDENKGGYEKLKQLVGGIVDEIFYTVAYNQAGQMDDRPAHAFKNTCAVPFSQLNVTQEGYLRACCNDYQNYLVTDDLSQITLEDAWTSALMRDFRRRHLEGQLEKTLCHNCINGTRAPVRPINSDLSNLPQI
jgi:sulfatase maturation enzyme AslB (radical SAM superfamily)